MSVLKIDHIYKSFRNVDAVQDLSLDLEPNVIFGFLGPNGAGKTTTIRMIMDIIKPDRGSIFINDQPNTLQMREKVGYLPEERGLYRKMKISELLVFMAELKGLSASQSKPKIEYWLERLELLDWIDKKVEELSRGMQQKLQFISTIMHEPDLIILDEPFTGLDPVNSDLIKQIMFEQKQRGATIIFSTHLMEQVEQLCDSICLINKGRIVLGGNIRDVKKEFRKNIIRMEFEGDATFIKNQELIERYTDHGTHYEIHPKESAPIQQILQAAAQEVMISKFELMEPSLHNIFIDVVTQKERNGS
ncbi:ATP-binding cassette domain-containing protein [candidate division KSB1 bacterium]|nr:ATP-binding cassette domain-containing protein [candidate division KSB1 bacterium]